MVSAPSGWPEERPVSSELGLLDTNGILRQPWVTPERTSAGLGWDKQYLSVQHESPYRESFAAAGTHLVILHRDGPVTVRRGQGKLSRSRQRRAGGLLAVLGRCPLGACSSTRRGGT